MDRRAVARLGLLTAAAAAAVLVAVHLDHAGAGALTHSVPAASGQAAASTAPMRSSARADLERGLPRPSGAKAAAVFDESQPHVDVVDPKTGRLISIAGAKGVVGDAADLGPVHEDPTPPGVSLDDPTDTRSLIAKAGLTANADASESPKAAASTTPPGTPIITSLSHHVVPSCSGTGTDGNRVQPMYVHEAGTADRFSSVLGVLRDEVANVDDVFAVSAQQTGGVRRVRWVHDAGCVPKILDVTVPSGALGSDFWGTVDALKKLGYDDPHRKYMMFADANQFCGIGSMYDDVSRTGNANDGRYAAYSRIDANCWSSSYSSVPAHELTHNLGGVLATAPHATTHGHCFDDADIMCYDDGSGIPMRHVCAAAQEQLLDCNHDDYFSTRPTAGSFLATNWNTASSSFLDTSLTSSTPPDVTMSASDTTAETGDPVTFTATSSKTVRWTWSKSANASACNLALGDPGQATLVCPSSVVGDVVVTATAAETGDTVTGSGSATVAMAKAAAPSATVSIPAAANAGDSMPVTVTPVGKAPFHYTWQAGPCAVAAPTAAATTVICRPDLPSEDVTVTVLVTQADGQQVRVISPVTVTGTSTTPIPLTWTRPALTLTTISSLLRDTSGAGLAGQPVTLQAQWLGSDKWVAVRTLTTDAGGRASTTSTYPQAGRLRFTSPGDTAFHSATSAAVLVKVHTVLRAHRPSQHRVTAVLRTTEGRPLRGAQLLLQSRAAGTPRWVHVATMRTNAAGLVSRAEHPRHKTYYRWVFRGEARHTATGSGSVTVR